MAEILTVSMSKADKEHLLEMDLSPSEIFQEILDQRWQLWRKNHEEVVKMQENIERLVKQLEEAYQFITIKGLENEFRKWRGENVLEKE